MRLLFARAGLLHCPTCAVPIAPRAPAALAEQAAEELCRNEVAVFGPIVRARKGSHRELLARAQRDGFTEARVDGRLSPLTSGMSLDRFKEHDVELLVGKAKAGTPDFYELLLKALTLGEGSVRLTARNRELLLSSRRACPQCGQGFPEPDPRFFSFNTRQGACERCEGHGFIEIEGKRHAEPERRVCTACNGKRLSGLALHTSFAGRPISDYFGLSVSEASALLKSIQLSGRDEKVAKLPLTEAMTRLLFLDRVGLSYLTLDRPAWSLSGGELQRVRLAAQLGSGLTGLLYVLDEPTIGLHPRDTDRLIGALRDLTGKGCSVLLVEHSVN